MANYNITLSDGVTVIGIPDGSTTYTAADIPLVGQNTQLYGSPVATAHLHHLENFANDTAPSVNPLDGQLWYDNGDITGVASLNVYDLGNTTWNRITSVGISTTGTESATLRWNDTSGAWQEEERVRISDAGELLLAFDDTASNVVTIQHDGTNLDIVGTAGTVDINVTGITAMNIPEITLTTALDETYGGTGQTVYAVGDVVYADTTTSLTKLIVGSNGDILTLAAGVPTWAASASAVSSLDDLSDVTLTTPANNSLLYRAAGQYIDSNIANLSFDGTDLSATQIGGIVEANLIDRAAPGTISGTATFTNANPIIATSGDIDATSGFGFVTTDGAVAAAFRADTGTNEIQFTHSNTPDWTVTGLGIVDFDNPVSVTGAGAQALRVRGSTSAWNTSNSYIEFYDNDENEYGLQIGTTAGTTTSRINARLGDLDLYALNTLTMSITNTTTSIFTDDGGVLTAMTFRNPFGVGANATTSATVADRYSGTHHNVGYNETPNGNLDVGSNLTVGSFTLSTSSIGKLLNRNVGTSRSITLDSTGISSDIPIGGSVLILNSQSGGTMTITPAVSDTLTWIDGSGSTPASAPRTLANNSICTVRRNTTTNWQIWGNGLS